MKKIALLVIISLYAIACSKQNATPATPVDETVDSTTATLLLSGSFSNGPFGSVTGTANIYTDSGKPVLELKDFVTSNGPDLHVYLSQEEQPVHFIDLGKLKSTNGNQVYSIPAGTNFTAYRYALIHCQEYNHLFGSTILEEQ